jgi:taurine dioxygenase
MNVTPLSRTFGARIADVDVTSLDEQEFAELEGLFHRHKLVVIPDQHLDDESQMIFAKRFGDTVAGSYGAKFSPRIQQITHNEKDPRRQDAEWHSDGMFWPEPPMAGVFRLIEGPEVGGDTMFADMSAAFEALSPAMREFLLPLRAVHDVRISAQHLYSPEQVVEMAEEYPPIAHPLIRTHPVTGVKSIYVSTNTTSHIDGLRRDESEALLAFLYAQALRPELQCRVHWDPGSVGVWDNRVLMHAAVHDYAPEVRVVRRISIAGTVPA